MLSPSFCFSAKKSFPGPLSSLLWILKAQALPGHDPSVVLAFQLCAQPLWDSVIPEISTTVRGRDTG